MKTLVYVEHEGGQIKDATLAAVTAASKLGEVHLLVAGRTSAASPRRRRRSPASARCMSPTPPHLEHRLAENVAPLAARLMDDHDAFVAPATTTGKNIAPRVAALLDVMQISRDPVGRGREHVHPADLRRQRHRHRPLEGRQEGHHRPRHRFREGRARGRQRARSSRSMPAPMRAVSSFVGVEASKSERPELTSAKIIVSGGRAFGSIGAVPRAARPARRQARRRRRRQPRRGRCRLCAQRLPGRPDRQDRRSGGLHRHRHFRRDPAPRRHEGLQGHRRHQQGRGSADLPGRRHRPRRRPVQDRPGADREAIAACLRAEASLRGEGDSMRRVLVAAGLGAPVSDVAAGRASRCGCSRSNLGTCTTPTTAAACPPIRHRRRAGHPRARSIRPGRLVSDDIHRRKTAGQK